MKPSKKEIVFNVTQNSFWQLIAVSYSCIKPSSTVKRGVRPFKRTCRLLLKSIGNLGPSWCLSITSKRLAHLENITLPNRLWGNGIHQDNTPWAKSLFNVLYFSLLGYGTHAAWESTTKVKFLSRCVIFWRPYFPLTPFPSTFPCCNEDSFHLLTSPEGLRDAESTSSWKKAL